MGFFVFVMFVIVTAIYVLPSIMAYRMHSRNTALICMLNLATGMTFIGWWATLILAFKWRQDQIAVKMPNGTTRMMRVSDRTEEDKKAYDEHIAQATSDLWGLGVEGERKLTR